MGEANRHDDPKAAGVAGLDPANDPAARSAVLFPSDHPLTAVPN